MNEPRYPVVDNYGGLRKNYRDNYREPEHHYRGYDRNADDINIHNSNLNKNADQVSNDIDMTTMLRTILGLLNVNFQGNSNRP